MLASRYRIHDELASDVEARTLLVHDTELDQPAIAMIPNPSRTRVTTSALWSGNTVSHPNLLAGYDTGSHGTAPYVVTEHPGRQTLLHELEDGAAPPSHAEHVAHGLVSALAVLHAAGIAHRHVGPATIALAPEGKAQLAPAPLAPHRGAGPGAPLGSWLAYRAPELAPADAGGAEADVYAAGATLYAALTGEAPPPDGLHATGDDPASLHRRRPDAPPELVAVVEQALAPDPTKRFPSAVEMLAALETGSALASSPAAIAAATTTGRPWHWRAAACLALGVGVVVGFRSGLAPPPLAAVLGVSPDSSDGPPKRSPTTSTPPAIAPPASLSSVSSNPSNPSNPSNRSGSRAPSNGGSTTASKRGASAPAVPATVPRQRVPEPPSTTVPSTQGTTPTTVPTTGSPTTTTPDLGTGTGGDGDGDGFDSGTGTGTGSGTGSGNGNGSGRGSGSGSGRG